jgi:hypothetical protein
MSRGGYREGAGRPKKDRTPVGRFETSQAYLEAVVKGEIEPDPARIQAARVLIQYETAKQRAPVKSPTAKQREEKNRRSLEESTLKAFEEAAKIIKLKFKNNQKVTK